MTTKSTKPVFKKFMRFDAAKAAVGVAHHIVDENGNDYGTWTTSLFDIHNKYLKVANERFEREHANDVQAKGKNAHLYGFVQMCVHNWTGVLDANDKEIPFSKELAFEYLNDDDNSWFANELVARSQDVTNYRAITPAATKEEDAGN
ncbi:hypothetical protein [Sphingomonas sp. R1]|uniref:hypothetical protein n=1 Tax=Sphingomonas sp. R1 TaxID=399176 RepID=UPI0022241B2E|nr:hypothetical protein [Sphingomonas sp. R1]UYY77493.1 hypothetical protein OIM94_00320 [Sphingomonas sp. R1]